MENKQSFDVLQPGSPLESEEMKIRIAVIGDARVGKSSLVHRFLYDNFVSETEPTIEDSYAASRVINTVSCQLNILDTGGHQQNQNGFNSWVYSSNAFLLVYSIDNKESFASAIEKYHFIKKAKQTEAFSIAIIGNKSDLIKERTVNLVEAQATCAALKVTFLEASAFDKTNINEAFLFVANNYINKKMKRMSKKECRGTCCLVI